jgi:hypothetical protein
MHWCFFFPTNYIYEAQPLVIFEAMSYGVPVIAADRGYIAEMIGSAGTVVPRNLDIVDTVITILRTFIEHPEELNRAREASRKQFLAMRAKAMAEIEELVDAILSPRIDRWAFWVVRIECSLELALAPALQAKHIRYAKAAVACYRFHGLRTGARDFHDGPKRTLHLEVE